MSLNFLPGVPNKTPQAVCQRSWNSNTILAYCSGNNLILLSNRSERLQTIYLPSDCLAVDVNPSNGLIAVAVLNEVFIYKPLHQIMKNPKWVFCIKLYHDNSQINSLQWGMKNELVMGSDYLSFWDIKDVFGEYKPRLLWSKRQPLPVYLCSITQDSKLISSMNYNDRNVKLWRRVSITADSDFFDLIILPHPDIVTSFRWKTADHQCDKEHIIHIFYTICADCKVRVWISFDIDNKKNVQNWGTVEMSKSANERFCVILDSWLIQKTIGSQLNEKTKNNKIMRFLIDEKPELVLFSTPDHKIRVIALKNLSDDIPKIMSTKELLKTTITTSSFGSCPEILHFPEPQLYDDENSISLVVHDLHGSVRHSLLHISSILENKENVGILQHKWTGHTKSIQKVFRSSDGSAVLTTSRFQENSLWTPLQLKDSVTLAKKALIATESPIRHALVHDKGNLVVTFLENYKIQVWECKQDNKLALLQSSIETNDLKGYPCLMVNTPEKDHHHNTHYFACVYSDGSSEGYLIQDDKIKILPSNNVDLEDDNEFYLITAIDPVRYHFQSDRSLIATITKEGIIRTYKAHADVTGILWKKSYETNTDVKKASKVTGSSNDKISVIDEEGTTMTLWDLRRSVLEYEANFDSKVIDIDWTSTELEQNIVAIGFENHVILYTQLRYDYTNRNPPYLPIEKVDVSKHTTHTIGDSTWLQNGSIVIATGNQIFVKDKRLDLNDKFTYRSIGSRKILSNDILHLTSVLNGPLPIYHPQLLIQSLFAKKVNLVREILLKLFHTLRGIEFGSEKENNQGTSLEIDPSKFLHSDNSTYRFDKYDEPYSTFDSVVCSGLINLLSKIPLPYLTRHQQVTLISVVEAVEEINQNEKIVDINGVRFMLGVKLYISHKSTQPSVSMRDVSWATHSDNKEIILSNLSNRIRSWENFREFKVAYWAEQGDLVSWFEKLAKLEFNNQEKRDPSRCSIFYLALKKKNILIGLWRISSGHHEQAKMLKFLNNDFSEKRWRTAALKNAFVLLSKHRFMDAASFFLLAGSLKDCVNVLLKQVNDLDLAIGVCRVYEGDNGPTLNEFLHNQVLPTAIIESDRWTTSYIYWKMCKQGLAIKALVQPPIELDDNTKWITKDKCINKSFLVEDPLLLQLYLQLRDRNIEYYNAALEVNESLEYDIIMRVVTIYTRMGCDYLAVALLQDWKFLEYKKSKTNSPPISQSSHAKLFDSTITEPVTTQKARPSLFDKFDTQFTENSGHVPIPGGTSSRSRSMLDSFSMEIPSSDLLGHKSSKNASNLDSGRNLKLDNKEDQPPISHVTNILDSFMSDSSFPKPTEKPKVDIENIPTAKTTKDNDKKQLSTKYNGEKNNTVKNENRNIKPRNLLDDFM